MKLLLYFLLCLIFITGCSGDDHDHQLHALDSLNMLNRNGKSLPVSNIQPLVDYFERNGTPNNKMLAYYLLGRAYHERHEVPIAMKYYQLAIDHSDTTQKNCDFRQLCKVYAQMGSIFYQQSLYQQHLKCNQSAKHFAWIVCDTLNALAYYEQEALAHKRLHHNDSALYIYNEIAHIFYKMNRVQDAAIALGGTLKILIETEQYEKARKNMSLYETSSGLFDNKGNIIAGREIFYYLKGLLYLREGRLNSAEFWFRKEMQEGKDFNNQQGAAKGLALLYETYNNADSAAKYYKYAYAMNDSIHNKIVAKEVEQTIGMYNYSRHQELVQKMSLKSERMANYIKIGTIIIVFLIFFIHLLIKKYRKGIKQKRQQFLAYLHHLEEAQTDILQLRNEELGKDLVIAQKERTISLLQKELMDYQRKSTKENHEIQEEKIKTSPIYQRFTLLSVKGQKPSQEEWTKIHVTVFEIFPHFRQLILSKSHSLNMNEYNACILIRLHFKPADLCNMLGISSAYANKIRINLLHKLFDKRGKAEYFDELIIGIF